MKRRDFIAVATVTAGLMVGRRAAATVPCPPILDGGDKTSSCNPADAEADWQSRISGAGVVWYHDFRNRAEVDNFRWSAGTGGGNDPDDLAADPSDRGTVNWVITDGITGGACLETLRKAGTNDGGNWWRPFSPIVGSGNGRGVDDPGAAGTISAKNYSPTQGGSQIADWNSTGGYYGHPSYHDARFDGHDYFIQSRVKMHPNRAAEPSGGKLFYFTRADRSLTSQELVTKSRDDSGTRFNMYRSGSPPLSNDPPYEVQPNSEHSAVWSWPLGEWVTVMYHIRGGTNASGFPGNPVGNQDTLVEVWVDWDGNRKVNKFIKIWEQPTVALPFDVIRGHNALIASGFMNGASFSQDIWQRFDQIIFSKEFISCPQV